MPSILFHELVGYKFANLYKNYDTDNFYLGLIVPDAVNAYGFASKEKRWAAHKRDVNLDTWTENIIDFYKKSYYTVENKYLMGYVVHVLTDIMCDKIYKEEIMPDLLKNQMVKDEVYLYYERSIEKFENSNINKKWWTYVQTAFQKARKIEINNINEKMIKDWIEYTVNKYSSRTYEKEGYITDKFVNKVLFYIKNILQDNKIID